ncbi:MAG: chemotaxis protein CheW [Rhodocyclaceae bacterium]
MAKRISLREFQQGLVEKLTSAQRGETPRAFLGVQAGNVQWLLELPETGEIVPLRHLTPVPLTKPWFRGLANVRGTLFSVVDFSAFLGSDPTPITSETRLVMANGRFGFSCALLVQRALGLRNLDQLDQLPDKLNEVAWVGTHFCDSKGIVWKKLLIKNLFIDPEFLEIAL